MIELALCSLLGFLQRGKLKAGLIWRGGDMKEFLQLAIVQWNLPIDLFLNYFLMFDKHKQKDTSNKHFIDRYLFYLLLHMGLSFYGSMPLLTP